MIPPTLRAQVLANMQITLDHAKALADCAELIRIMTTGAIEDLEAGKPLSRACFVVGQVETVALRLIRSSERVFALLYAARAEEEALTRSLGCGMKPTTETT
jgi:hypothetical protein